MSMFSVFAIFFLCLSVLAAGCQAAALAGLGRLRRHKGERAPVRPPMTILRPVCGTEPELEKNLRTLCRQSYPTFQVVFGVAADDAAVPVIDRLLTDFPAADLVLAKGSRGDNARGCLAAALKGARHDLLAVVGSGLRVDRHFLEAIAAPFADPQVGAVVCLASGAPAGGLAANLGALDLTDRAIPAALLAARLQTPECARGAVVAIRRPVLTCRDEIAEPEDCLADPFLLDELLGRNGWQVHLSSYQVEKLVAASDLRRLFWRELATSRQERRLRPAAHLLGLLPRCSLTLALLFLAVSLFAPAAWLLLAAALILRLLLHLRLRHLLRVPPPTVPWLLPMRDLFSFGVWAGSYIPRRPTAEASVPEEDDAAGKPTAAGG